MYSSTQTEMACVFLLLGAYVLLFVCHFYRSSDEIFGYFLMLLQNNDSATVIRQQPYFVLQLTTISILGERFIWLILMSQKVYEIYFLHPSNGDMICSTVSQKYNKNRKFLANFP